MIAKLIRERILTVPTKVAEIPPAERDEVNLENTLFGWILHLGRHKVPCKTEAEARYLAAFAKLDFTQVIIPRRQEDIQKVLADVEKDVSELLAYIDSRTASELHVRRRNQVLHMVLEGIQDRIEKAIRPPEEAKDKKGDKKARTKTI